MANAYYQFTNTITDIAQNRFGFSYIDAKNFLSIIQIGVMVMLPIFSYIMMKYGHKSTCLLVSGVILCLSYLNMIRIPLENSSKIEFYLSISGISVFYAMYSAAIWPSMALSMPREVVSVGYGLASLSQMVPMSCFPYFVGLLSSDRTPESYQKVLYFVLALAVLALCIVVFVNVVDRRGSKVLLLPENSKEVNDAREEINLNFIYGAKKIDLGIDADRGRNFSKVSLGTVSDSKESNFGNMKSMDKGVDF